MFYSIVDTDARMARTQHHNITTCTQRQEYAQREDTWEVSREVGALGAHEQSPGEKHA
jgi:hypothetical protein